jgi:hypothetical protein
VKDHARTLNLWLKLSTDFRTAHEGENHYRKGNHMNDFDSVGDYAVPVDPMDDLQCESCQ